MGSWYNRLLRSLFFYFDLICNHTHTRCKLVSPPFRPTLRSMWPTVVLSRVRIDVNPASQELHQLIRFARSLYRVVTSLASGSPVCCLWNLPSKNFSLAYAVHSSAFRSVVKLVRPFEDMSLSHWMILDFMLRMNVGRENYFYWSKFTRLAPDRICYFFSQLVIHSQIEALYKVSKKSTFLLEIR